MKKIVLILTMVIMVFANTMSLATVENSSEPSLNIEAVSGESIGEILNDDEEISDASDKILSNMSKKDRKIAEYTDKFNNETMGNVAYWLEVVQLYSIPVFIVLLIMGAFNFYIIGEKKLDKKEQGFSFIMSALCGLVFFQVLPFIFALLVAGK